MKVIVTNITDNPIVRYGIRFIPGKKTPVELDKDKVESLKKWENHFKVEEKTVKKIDNAKEVKKVTKEVKNDG